jgi:hypothetical protein
MSVDLMADSIRECVLAVLRNKPCTMPQLKAATFMQEVPVMSAIRDLRNSQIIEQGYLTDDGDWLDDWFPDEHQHIPIDAWRVCK